MHDTFNKDSIIDLGLAVRAAVGGLGPVSVAAERCGRSEAAVKRSIRQLIAGKPARRVATLLTFVDWLGLVPLAIPAAEPDQVRHLSIRTAESLERLALLLRNGMIAAGLDSERSVLVSKLVRELEFEPHRHVVDLLSLLLASGLDLFLVTKAEADDFAARAGAPDDGSAHGLFPDLLTGRIEAERAAADRDGDDFVCGEIGWITRLRLDVSTQAQTPEDVADAAQTRRILEGLLSTLPARRQQVMRLIYGFDGPEQTPAEVARLFGFTRGRVGQIQQDSLNALARAARKAGLGPIEFPVEPRWAPRLQVSLAPAKEPVVTAPKAKRPIKAHIRPGRPAGRRAVKIAARPIATIVPQVQIAAPPMAAKANVSGSSLIDLPTLNWLAYNFVDAFQFDTSLEVSLPKLDLRKDVPGPVSWDYGTLKFLPQLHFREEPQCEGLDPVGEDGPGHIPSVDRSQPASVEVVLSTTEAAPVVSVSLPLQAGENTNAGVLLDPSEAAMLLGSSERMLLIMVEEGWLGPSEDAASSGLGERYLSTDVAALRDRLLSGTVECHERGVREVAFFAAADLLRCSEVRIIRLILDGMLRPRRRLRVGGLRSLLIDLEEARDVVVGRGRLTDRHSFA